MHVSVYDCFCVCLCGMCMFLYVCVLCYMWGVSVCIRVLNPSIHLPCREQETRDVALVSSPGD